DVSGQNIYADLAKMPHLLIGGATNSGKSIGLISIIMSLLLRNTPKDLQLALLDPKRVELSLFEGLPHLICPVVTDLKQMPLVLRQIAGEMDRRYDLLAETKCRNLEAYNEKVPYAERLPYLVVVIDELADLMISSAKEVETSIARIAQLARATGIHLVIATQRPSVDVITGTIKANISSRIAYAVSSQVDSRTILDGPGAESLIGQGDMLFLPIDAPKPIRVQGCYVTEKDVSAVCDHWKSQAKPHYAFDPASLAIEREETRMRWEEENDPFWEQAVRFAVERGEVSTSMLQRHFAIGFQRASRLLDMMEERGIVAPRDGPRPREVLISPAEIDLYLRK
ncbi:MAG: DNA translocase FtsK, partial [Fimbriimonadales bacterium]|nr:DNA translocase FtsK [Fimbriimonadales bacterium]